MTKSSINLQIAKIIAFLHNCREAIVTYTIADRSRNDYDRNGQEAYKYYLDLLGEASCNYTKRTNQRIQTDEKKFLWEAVINLNEDHTLKELQVLARILRMNHGWQPVQIAVHRDEGHKDQKSGKNVYNYHAHIVLFMLDKQGIYRFKKRDYGVKKMAELQTLVAKVLKMERGVSKTITKRVRLEHVQYKQVKQAEKEILAKYNILQMQMNVLLPKISQLRKHKRKTAKALRNKGKIEQKNDQLKTSNISSLNKDDEVRELNSIIQRYRFFFQKIVVALKQNIENYPLISQDGLSKSGLITGWIIEAQNHILSLVLERDELSDMAYSMITIYDEFTGEYSEFPISYKELYEEQLKINDELTEEYDFMSPLNFTPLEKQKSQELKKEGRILKLEKP